MLFLELGMLSKLKKGIFIAKSAYLDAISMAKYELFFNLLYVYK